MNIRKIGMVMSLVFGSAVCAQAAVSAKEAEQLGKNLTLVGAEKAGNKDGSIPEYTGGLTTPPAGFKKGSGFRPDPFASEKPLYSINSKNVAQYADELTEGAKALMKKYPTTYRVDVYKTHRTVAFPKYVLDNTVKLATTAKTTNGGLSIEGAHGGYPFPIPKSGFEAMWNHMLSFSGLGKENESKAYIVDRSGRATVVTESTTNIEYPYYDHDKPNAKDFFKMRVLFTGPPRQAGSGLLVIDPIDYGKESRHGWQYLPGQRRVKLAPELAFDTPQTSTGGASTWDDLFLFSGSMERYNFKLVGKKEVIIPYNDYKMVYSSKSQDLFKPNHLNPDLIRWEKHRVWVVEAILNPGKRHLYSKRVFYLDEDSWAVVASDEYDGHGQLYRSFFSYMAPSYDVPAPMFELQGGYDLISNQYFVLAWPAEGKNGIRYPKKMPEKEWSPDALAGSGVR